MLGLDNPIHIAFVLVLLLLVFGAKRLPEMGRSVGEGLRGFKDSISGEPNTTHLTEASSSSSDEQVHVYSTEPSPQRASVPAGESTSARPAA